MTSWSFTVVVLIALCVAPGCRKSDDAKPVRKAGPNPGFIVDKGKDKDKDKTEARSGARTMVVDGIKGSVNQPEAVPPPATTDELNRALTMPAGFRIEAYTTEVPNARAMALSDSGVLYVGTRKLGKVYAVVDSDGDDRADRVHVVAQDLTMPVGVDLRDGALYISSLDRVVRLDGIDDRLENPPTPVVVSDGFPGEAHHGWKFIRFGPDGWLYVPVGAPCNLCLKDDERYASIMRMRPDGSGLEVYAHGVRNTVGFDWHPESKALWFTDNGRDWLGDDAPGDELNRATEKGQHFGYPFCHAGAIADPEFGARPDGHPKGHPEGHKKDEAAQPSPDEVTDRRPCGDFVPPAQVLDAHVAGLGMRFYTGEQFPVEYRGAIFIAEHGSWNRADPSGYRVTVVQLGPDGQVASYKPFVQGFLRGDGAWGRPVDVLVRPDGSLLVSDDRAGQIYRITYDGAPRP